MDEYVRAVAAALRTEYRAIVDRGLLLQIDAPDLAMERHMLFADRPLASSSTGSSWSSTPSTARSTGIDPAHVRLHVCWGNYEGPAHPRRRPSPTSSRCCTRPTSARW